MRCGDVITTDTTLDSDLLACPNNGIVIGADNITLDLNGHTIAGDDKAYELCREDEPCDIGVLNDGYDAVTVKRGTTRDFGLGVVVVGAKHNRVRHVAAVGNAFEGIVIFRSTRTRIEESFASRNGVGKSRPGIALAESDHNRITGNTMSRNGDLALFMEASDHNLIRNNEARGNPEDGMIIEGNRNEIVRNRLVRNGGGILITIVRRGGKSVGNVVSRNVVRNARAGGIAVDRVPKRTLVSRNLVVGSGRAGIIVGSRSTTITDNRAVRNGGLGIRAVKGVIDGGGNRASGNGDPRQCIVVACR
ncbi:MAG TPA: NosD domain-containing protein [Thermoleophilaceae bacterium]|nr:NosD domain-containing protein [Thermoleophilaceae bacterium]